jgi:hypothetical protein
MPLKYEGTSSIFSILGNGNFSYSASFVGQIVLEPIGKILVCPAEKFGLPCFDGMHFRTNQSGTKSAMSAVLII